MKWLTLVALAVGLSACVTIHQEDSRARIIGQTLTSTVQLFDVRKDGAHRAASGVVLGPARNPEFTLILTTKHLLTPMIEQTVTVVDPRWRKQVVAKIVAVSAEHDLALLEVGDLTLTPVVFKTRARLGDPIWVVAFPWGRRRTFVSGVVSQIASDEEESNEVPIEGAVRLVDAPVSYGTSGGGIYDATDGALLGLVRGYRSAELAVPGSESGVLKIPVAGETTVVSTEDIRRFLKTQNLEHLFNSGPALVSQSRAQQVYRSGE
jgi:S1-C subfamily serine protease